MDGGLRFGITLGLGGGTGGFCTGFSAGFSAGFTGGLSREAEDNEGTGGTGPIGLYNCQYNDIHYNRLSFRSFEDILRLAFTFSAAARCGRFSTRACSIRSSNAG